MSWSHSRLAEGVTVCAAQTGQTEGGVLPPGVVTRGHPLPKRQAEHISLPSPEISLMASGELSCSSSHHAGDVGHGSSAVPRCSGCSPWLWGKPSSTLLKLWFVHPVVLLPLQSTLTRTGKGSKKGGKDSSDCKTDSSGGMCLSSVKSQVPGEERGQDQFCTSSLSAWSQGGVEPSQEEPRAKRGKGGPSVCVR